MKILLIKFGFTVLLLVFLATRVDLGGAVARLGTLSLAVVVLALVIGLVQIFVLAYRWILVSRLANLSLPLPEALRCCLASQFFSQGLPASVGGDALRLWWLNRMGTSMRQAVHSVLLDRIAGLVALVALSLIAIATLLVLVKGAVTVSNLGWIIGSVAAVLIIGATRWSRGLMLRAFRSLPYRIRGRPLAARIMRWVTKLHHGTWQLFFTREGLVIISWGIAIHLSAVALCYILARDAGVAVTLVQLLSVVPPVMLLSYLPLSIGGWGLREGSMALGLGLVGVPTQDGVFIGLALGSVVLGSALIGALVWVFSPMPVSLFGRRTPLET